MLIHRCATPVFPRRVVVLGGSGFIGRTLSQQLTAAGVETISLSSRDVDLAAPASVKQLSALLRPDDAVVFASAITREKGRDVVTFMKNLTMGQHVAAVLAAARCSHVIYISSDAVYEDAPNPIRETTCTSPTDLYGLMHAVRERMLRYALQGRNTPFAVLRLCAVYGPEDSHNSYGPNRFARTASREGKISLFGGGEEKRDHLFVEDAGRLMVFCLQCQSQGLLNVATGTAVTFREVAQVVRRLSQKPVEIECLPRAGAISHRHFDVTACVRAFPFFRFTPLEVGLAQTFARLASVPDGQATSPAAG